jgi:Sec7-like guanine-nucleotide exchange factor
MKIKIKIKKRSTDDVTHTTTDNNTNNNNTKSNPNKSVLTISDHQAIDAHAIATFLKLTPGLGKTQIGEFISKGPADIHPFHAAVLSEYVQTFDFSGLFIVGCLLFFSF